MRTVEAGWAETVVARLEEAGATLMALPYAGHSTAMRGFWPAVVNDFIEAYGWNGAELRASVPSAQAITRMDEALGWIALIPRDKYVVRRIVGARALVSPVTARHVFSWRRLGLALGADHRAVQQWHAQGIRLIVASLPHEKLLRIA